MQWKRLFENGCISGRLGVYPFTAENLFRVGVALCVYLKLEKGLERPKLSVLGTHFLTLSVAVGFMAGGGDVLLGFEGGDLSISREGEENLRVEGLEEHELRLIESLLFGRHSLPRAEGEEVGRIWTREERL
ncbi:MAG: hypothetical protein NZ526_01630 [Aquificaceae bacterium]|nr:hypothetical protein [Aquificaceae bacterium]MDW8095334.1 hypothetical protein [Aquificaceae bacterium]